MPCFSDSTHADDPSITDKILPPEATPETKEEYLKKVEPLMELPLNSEICEPADGSKVELEGAKSIRVRGYALGSHGKSAHFFRSKSELTLVCPRRYTHSIRQHCSHPLTSTVYPFSTQHFCCISRNRLTSSRTTSNPTLRKLALKRSMDASRTRGSLVAWGGRELVEEELGLDPLLCLCRSSERAFRTNRRKRDESRPRRLCR